MSEPAFHSRHPNECQPRRSFDALHESEARFRATFEQAAVGIAHVNLDGHWIRVNRKLCEILAYPADELLTLTFQDITHADDLDADLACVERLLRGEIDTYEMEKRYRRKDGAIVWANLTGSLVRRPDGQPDYFIAVVEDISRRKELERQVRTHAAELEMRVQQRTRDLQEANEALEAFGYSISHDLRAPLRNMQSLAQALEEDHAQALGATGRDFCRRISQAAARMDSLINDLLTFSRVSRADLPLSRVDLDSTLIDVKRTIAPAAAAVHARLTVAEHLPAVTAHRPTLVQILQNLVSNALKFVAAGVAPDVQLWAEDRGACVRICVRDNGIGIAPQHQTRIFDVFERLHGEATYAGTGIGLAIVKRGAERMAGRVGVASAAGQGSLFWIDLPKAPNT